MCGTVSPAMLWERQRDRSSVAGERVCVRVRVVCARICYGSQVWVFGTFSQQCEGRGRKKKPREYQYGTYGLCASFNSFQCTSQSVLRGASAFAPPRPAGAHLVWSLECGVYGDRLESLQSSKPPPPGPRGAASRGGAMAGCTSVVHSHRPQDIHTLQRLNQPLPATGRFSLENLL